MNIIPINKSSAPSNRLVGDLFARMEHSLKSAHIDLGKSIRIAKTLAPILNDQSSNERHLRLISSEAPIHEKVIAILMLGFPNNRSLLPILSALLRHESEAVRMAAAISIAQMRNGENNEILSDILFQAFTDESSLDVKKTIRKAMLSLMDQKTAHVVKGLSEI
jgi:HEAT repeat protein